MRFKDGSLSITAISKAYQKNYGISKKMAFKFGRYILHNRVKITTYALKTGIESKKIRSKK